MAKIPDMTAADPLTGAEQVEVVQGGNTRRTTAQDVADLVTVPADLDDLDDVDTDAATDGDVLAYDDGEWEPDGTVVRSDDVNSIVLVEESDWPPDPEVDGVMYVKVEDEGS
jgi:hypothetical protein